MTFDQFLVGSMIGYMQGQIKVDVDLTVLDMAVQFFAGECYSAGKKSFTKEEIASVICERLGPDFIGSDMANTVWLRKNE